MPLTLPDAPALMYSYFLTYQYFPILRLSAFPPKPFRPHFLLLHPFSRRTCSVSSSFRSTFERRRNEEDATEVRLGQVEKPSPALPKGRPAEGGKLVFSRKEPKTMHLYLFTPKKNIPYTGNSVITLSDMVMAEAACPSFRQHSLLSDLPELAVLK